MPLPRASSVAGRVLLGLGVALTLLLSGCANVPQTTVMPKTEAARQIQDLYVLIFWGAVVVFVGVQGAIFYIVWRYRRRPGNEVPPQLHGNTRLEIAWTILPAVILVVIAVPSIQTIFALESAPPPSPDGNPALEIIVTGKQWWWEYRYPDPANPDDRSKDQVVTANELVIPTGRTVRLWLRSDNVIHSFWVPQLMGKQDVVPGITNHLWFTAEEPGQYFGQCAEFCGIQHAQMRMNVIAMTPPDYQAWFARESAVARPNPEAEDGAQAFTANGCAGCHTVSGTTAVGTTGPNLSHVGSRTTIAAGILHNTPENLAAWIRDPQAIKPGNHMPTLHVRPQDVDALVAYLESMK
ncbi:MAG: cytochrome c oxidase subunit II [Chloroflexi bacterium]|nr:cytochrome c oxidase subunit II [Chloroflexota bacterium]